MMVKYSSTTGLMYIHFLVAVPNIQKAMNHSHIFKFVAKANEDLIVGYEIECASSNIEFVLSKLNLNIQQKLAIADCFSREILKKGHKEFSTTVRSFP